jgi:hypothetical protein
MAPATLSRVSARDSRLFLQLALHPAGVLAAGAGDQVAVVLVQAQSRLGVRIQAHLPAATIAHRVDVRGHVLHRGGVQRRAGARVEAADQRGGDGHLVLAGTQLARQLGDVVAREQFQLAVDDGERQLALRGGGVELLQLAAQAVAQVEAGHAQRIEALQAAAHRLDLV